MCRFVNSISYARMLAFARTSYIFIQAYSTPVRLSSPAFVTLGHGYYFRINQISTLTVFIELISKDTRGITALI
jgi:hypothetical protein